MLDALHCSLPCGILHAPWCLTQLSLQALLSRHRFRPSSSIFAIFATPVFTAFHDQYVSRSLAAETLHCFFFKSMMRLGFGVREQEQEMPLRRGVGMLVVRSLPKQSSVIHSVMRRCEKWDGLKQWTVSVKKAELCQGTEKVLHSK